MLRTTFWSKSPGPGRGRSFDDLLERAPQAPWWHRWEGSEPAGLIRLFYVAMLSDIA